MTFRTPAPIFSSSWTVRSIPSLYLAKGILNQEQVAINKFRSNRREAVAKLKKEDIDYKRLDVLTQFITPTGKIEAARRTGANRKQQAQVVRAIKRARYLSLMPYTRDDAR